MTVTRVEQGKAGHKVRGTVLGMCVALTMGTGCADPAWLSFITPLQASDGSTQVGITFINETDFRAITFWGGYNPLAPAGLPGQTSGPQVAKLVVEAGDQQFLPLTCFRRIELGGSALKRAVELGRPDDVEAGDINNRIGFSDLPLDDPDFELPTAGFADAVRFEIGVDYTCGDALEIRFKRVADQFVIELTVVE